MPGSTVEVDYPQGTKIVGHDMGGPIYKANITVYEEWLTDNVGIRGWDWDICYGTSPQGASLIKCRIKVRIGKGRHLTFFTLKFV